MASRPAPHATARRLRRGLLHLLATVAVLICAGPVLVVVQASFKDLRAYENLGFSLTGWTVRNYQLLITGTQLPRWLLNSLIVCAAVTLLTLAIDMMAGFAFAKLRFAGREGFFLLLISTMMLPFSITLVPTYLLVSRYGLVDTYAGLILPALSGPIGVYLMRQFIRGIPDALLESARIDGASTWKAFRAIVVPLCRQPMAVLAIFTFVANWNSFLWPLLITRSEEMRTLTVGIATTNLQLDQNLGSLAAQATISLIPMLILFILFQRAFLQGITAGALKG